jgi:hypothetical protein
MARTRPERPGRCSQSTLWTTPDEHSAGRKGGFGRRTRSCLAPLPERFTPRHAQATQIGSSIGPRASRAARSITQSDRDSGVRFGCPQAGLPPGSPSWSNEAGDHDQPARAAFENDHGTRGHFGLLQRRVDRGVWCSGCGLAVGVAWAAAGDAAWPFAPARGMWPKDDHAPDGAVLGLLVETADQRCRE